MPCLTFIDHFRDEDGVTNVELAYDECRRHLILKYCSQKITS